MRKRLAVILALALLTAGCAVTQIKVIPYNEATVYPNYTPEEIKIFRNFPPQKYEKVGEVEVEAPGYNPESYFNRWYGESPASFDDKLREAAADIGGDAVVITKDEPVGVTDKVSVPAPYGRRVEGVVIKFRD